MQKKTGKKEDVTATYHCTANTRMCEAGSWQTLANKGSSSSSSETAESVPMHHMRLVDTRTCNC